MANKNLASLMSGFMGEANDNTESANEIIDTRVEVKVEETQAPISAPEVKETPKSKRGPGRPKKSEKDAAGNEIRATFIVNESLLRKLKYISLAEGGLIKDVLNEALVNHIDAWEAENGKIRLPKIKN